MRTDVSVVIISFNTKTLTINCIKSIVNEGSSLTKEIIIVDNGSTDGSKEAIEKYSRESAGATSMISKEGGGGVAPIRVNSRKPTLSLINNQTNLGFAKANNQGIGEAKGEYILLLNSDTQVKQDSIGRLIEFAEKEEFAGVVGPRLLNPNGTTQASVFRQPTLSRAIKQYWLGSERVLDKYFPEERDPVEVEVLVMSAFLITPQAKEKVGLLDERYFMYFEDFDYCKRVREVGLKVYYYPGAQVIHCHGESGKMLADKENQWRRLIPSSKIYHGTLKHYLLNFIIWSSQKWQRLLK